MTDRVVSLGSRAPLTDEQREGGKSPIAVRLREIADWIDAGETAELPDLGIFVSFQSSSRQIGTTVLGLTDLSRDYRDMIAAGVLTGAAGFLMETK